jgi:hypothetical protein
MEQIRLGKYLGIFTAVFILAVLIAMLIVYLLDVNLGLSSGIIEFFVSSYITVMVFVRDNNRLPTREERRKLVWYSFFVSLLVVIIPLMGLLAYLGFSYGLTDLLQGINEVVPKLPGLAWTGILVFTLVLSYLSMAWSYWISATRLGKYFLK